MASGFGDNKFSTSYVTVGYGRIYCGANVSQSIDYNNRTVTITVRALLTYYRAGGGSWNPGTSTLFYQSGAGNYITATVDGSSVATGTTIGLNGANQNLYVGNYYNLYIGGVTAYGEAQVYKSATFSYNAAGDAITKTWSATVNYLGTALTVSGSVTTDSISSAGDPPSSGFINNPYSSYTNNRPTIGSPNAGVNDGNLTLTTLRFYVSEQEFSTSVPSRYVNFTNNSAVALNSYNSDIANNGITLEYNKTYYTGIYATNSKGSYSFSGPSVVTVPAPASYSLLNVNADNVEISYTTTADNSAHQVTIQYSTDNGGTWVDGPTIGYSGESKHGTIIVGDLSPNTNYTILLRTSTMAGSTQSGEILVTTKKAILYGSVNGDSEEIVKLYGSVGGQSKAIKKLYGSVNGRAKLIYKEN